MNRAQAEKLCEDWALSGAQFTAAQMTEHLYREAADDEVEGVRCFRIADAVIQRLRRRGLIGFRREGRLVVWAVRDA